MSPQLEAEQKLVVERDRLASDDAYREDMAHRFLTDFFFAAEVLGFNDFNHRHQVVADFYFPKNPNIAMRDQDPIHRRLHLDPRHTFKTTAKRVDRIQWIAAFPRDVTILTQSATQPLARAVSEASSKPFYRRPGRPKTIFQHLFPHLIVETEPEGVWNTAEHAELIGPGDLDTTLAFTSPKTSQSGWHPFIMEPDDVEDADNSGIGVKQETRDNVTNKCDQNENLLRDGGFLNICGTRYHPFDYYGKQIERAQRDPSLYKILIRCSLKTKDGSRLVPGEFPAEDEIELQFPEFANLGYSELCDKFYNSYESFMCQQQNDPQGGNTPTFDEAVYNSCLIDAERVPLFGGEIFICWRPSYRDKKYSEGAAARIVNGKVFVIDCWQGNYIPSQFAKRVVQTQKEHQADGVMILEVPGSNHLVTEIRNEGSRRNVSMRPQPSYWEEDEDRRASNIKRLEPLMKVGRLLFSTGMSKAAECRKQFVHFGLVEEDGIIECVSKFADLVPLSQMRANMQEEELEWQRRGRDNAMLSSFLQQQGMPQVDEQLKQKADATLQAMSKLSHVNFPPLPGGLDG